MQSQTQHFHIFPQQTPLKDPDVEHLKILIDRAFLSNQSNLHESHHCREEEYLHTISILQRKISELTQQINEIDRKYTQVQVELKTQQSKRKQEVSEYQKRLSQLQNEKQDWGHPKDLQDTQIRDKNIQSSLSHQSPSPSRAKTGFIQRTQTPINDLLEFSLSQSEPSRDQIYRLHSYLLQNTTTLKLLLEKQKYLIKIREMGHPSEGEESQTLSKTQRVVLDRRIEQQAQSVLYKKGYYEQDRSLSDIQNEDNFISSQ